MSKVLYIILGPTGVGKTEWSLSFAEKIGSPIISADSRQIYRALPIGTAAPTAEQQARVKHYFIGNKELTESYNAAQYEADALQLIHQLFQTHDELLVVGGSMLYIDALCKGLDDIPTVTTETRVAIQKEYSEKGLQWLQQEAERLDPQYFTQVDIYNPQRLLHCVEVCRQTGKPYSSFRTGVSKQRDFEIRKLGCIRERAELYERINQRTLQMLQEGWIEEARAVLLYRYLNSLQTVGYKELFQYFDGTLTLDEATTLIQQHTRNYAKRQLTWFRKDTDIQWFTPQGEAVSRRLIP